MMRRMSLLQPIYRYCAPTCSSRRLLSDSPAATATAAGNDQDQRRVVMLNSIGCRADDKTVADAKTVAESRTSTGRHLRVSFRCAAPPASSYLYYDFLDVVRDEDGGGDDESMEDGGDDDKSIDDDSDEDDESMDDDSDEDDKCVRAVAAHGELLLLETYHRRHSGFEDHFVYCPAGAGRPPSLSLLPVRDFLTKKETNYATYQLHPPFRPWLRRGSTGLLRRGENGHLVVQVELWYDRDARRRMAEFCVLRPGMRRWELMEPVPIALPLQEDGDHKCDERPLLYHYGSEVICVGDRFLCWVDCKRGFLLCDMADDASPKARYVPRPRDMHRDDEDDDPIRVRYMGAAGGGSVRFVSVDPRCCCGSSGRSTCSHSRFSFTINTWTMKLGMDEPPLAWVKDGEIDCEEIWGLPGYEGLPRANFRCPLVCSDNPNVVCFLVSNDEFCTGKDPKVWMIWLNIKTKTLLSVAQFNSKSCQWFIK